MSTDSRSDLLAAIAGELPADLLTREPDQLAIYGRDWTRAYTPAPLAVARPRTTAEVARVIALCRRHGQAVVPSGGRTGLAGGAVAQSGELVLSLDRMSHIGPIDTVGRTVRVEAGAVTERVHGECAAHGLFWPIDLASKGSSHIGGNLATNAGGVKVIRYGHARHWVLGLEVVLASGEVLELGGALEKDNTGVDLRQLFIGSEGTLGVITAATLKLTRPPDRVRVALFGLDSIDAGLALFADARGAGLPLTAYELFTESCMARVRAHRRIAPPLDGPSPCYVLVEAEAPAGALDPLEAWTESALGARGVEGGVLAQSAAQAQSLWRLREGISESLGATGLPHKNDVALPIAVLGDFCRELEAVFAARYPGWEICLFGHVGDGNIHINVMKPDRMERDEFFRRTGEADHAVFELVQRFGGSISAEHGVGLVKKAYLGYTRGPAEMALMRTIKRALDPDNILNPGKIFDL
ncbi:MAG TPA: FAD-binding oxidoreductase [Kofleriaceae bacterium]|nr:FAD-binding oxidoreductase [Kofleriaceae bacterium]